MSGIGVLGVLLVGQIVPSLHEAGAIFPPEKRHNHSSTIVECPDGDLLVCWYRGSGERKADDVQVMGSRRASGATAWSAPFVLADTPGYPDTNPTLFIDPRGKLWLLWPVILANEWHTALMTYKVSSRYSDDTEPIVWEEEKNLLLKPGPEFLATVERAFAEMRREGVPVEAENWFERNLKDAADKLATRLGWMTRVHPIVIGDKRMIVPLYSDGFDFSLMALSDDWGKSWQASAPLVGGGSVQPTLVVRKDGSIVAYLRDNGPPPKRLLFSESRDQGQTWSRAVDTEIPNPGTGAEVIALRDGLWALVNNDTEFGRASLAIWLSPDEGKSWPWKRHLEPGPDFTGDRSASYPSIIEARDGTLHITYSRFTEGKTIFHVHVNVAWVKTGNPE